MSDHGLVFEHTFSRQKLGFAIVLAKYGDEGRVFVQIEKTTPPCPLYPDTLRPSDELIAVDGDLIIDPTSADFERLRERLSKSRPVKLLFVKGELRDRAFEDQERAAGVGPGGFFSFLKVDAQLFMCCASADPNA